MKHTITLLLLFFYCWGASGQNIPGRTFLQTNSKSHLFYADLYDSVSYVYYIGRYYDVAASGFWVMQTDTLIRKNGSNYLGKHTEIIRKNNRFFLLSRYEKKTKKLPLDTATSSVEINTNLNNACYLKSYFEMSDELNQQYSLNSHSFRNGFYTWRTLQNKDEDYIQFRVFANRRIKEIKDSICRQQDKKVALTNFILANINSLDYPALHDSIIKIPPEWNTDSYYYGTVINEIAIHKPEYFFRIAEDFPENKSLIFFSVEDHKATIQGLKMVEGHDTIKKEFFKDRKYGKTMPYRIFGTYLLSGAILALLIF